MRITCPFCGERDHAEFAYSGDATVTRPAPAGRPSHDDPVFLDYVYMRANPAGPHREYWQHAGGCRSWLVVERDTTTHAIGRVTMARPAPGAPGMDRGPGA